MRPHPQEPEETFGAAMFFTIRGTGPIKIDTYGTGPAGHPLLEINGLIMPGLV